MSDSPLETKFLSMWQYHFPHIPLAREGRLIPNRRFAFDFAHLHSKVAIEINGGNWINGRHTQAPSLVKEYEKLNLAQECGYIVYILDSTMITQRWILKIYESIMDRSKL